MDDSELIRRARTGEVIGRGTRQVELLAARLETMEEAVRAGQRLVDFYRNQHNSGHWGHMPWRKVIARKDADHGTLTAAAELLEGEG